MTDSDHGRVAAVCGVLAIPALVLTILAPAWVDTGFFRGFALWVLAIVGVASGVRTARRGPHRALGVGAALLNGVLFAAMIWLTFVSYR